MRALGLFGLSIGEEYGGLGLTMEEEVLAVLELGRTSPAFRSVFGTNVGIGSQGLVLAGTPEQKAAWLPQLASGDVIASFALTEPDAGSDAASLRTRATRDGDGWRLNGTKRYITNAPEAGLFTVMARTGAPKARAPTASAPSWSRPARRASRSARPTARWASAARTPPTSCSTDCRVPGGRASSAREGEGFRIAMRVLDKGRLHIAALCTAMAERMLDDALRYALERRQFGQRIADFQLVQAMLADSRAECLAARSMVVEAARRRDAGEDVGHRRVVLQALRLRDVRPRRRPRRADLRRRRLHRRLRHRALLPRRAPLPHLRGHQPDPAGRHRARHDPARGGLR